MSDIARTHAHAATSTLTLNTKPKPTDLDPLSISRHAGSSPVSVGRGRRLIHAGNLVLLQPPARCIESPPGQHCAETVHGCITLLRQAPEGLGFEKWSSWCNLRGRLTDVYISQYWLTCQSISSTLSRLHYELQMHTHSQSRRALINNAWPQPIRLNLLDDLHNVLVLQHVVLAHSLRPVLGAAPPHQRIPAQAARTAYSWFFENPTPHPVLYSCAATLTVCT
jgi:hypothetical protein